MTLLRRPLASVLCSLVVLPVMAVAACVEEPPPDEEPEPNPLQGFYAVTLHTTASPCDAAPVDAVDDVTHFKLEETTFFLVKVLGFFACDAAGVCDESTDLNRSGIGKDNRVESSFSSGDEVTCSVGSTIGNWTATATGVRLETTDRRGTLEAVEACEPELAVDRADELACDTVTVIEGDSVEVPAG